MKTLFGLMLAALMGLTGAMAGCAVKSERHVYRSDSGTETVREVEYREYRD